MHETTSIKPSLVRHQRSLPTVLALVFTMLAGTAAIGFMSNAIAGADQADETKQTIRIGTYDSRAVAVAYVRSDMSALKLKDLFRERSEAEARGDTKRVNELNKLGESMQIRRHLQGFSNAPVDDILELVKGDLPAVAQQHDVAVITSSVGFHSQGVELIDVTDSLVALFEPDAQTLKMIKALRKHEPEAIEAVAQMPAVK